MVSKKVVASLLLVYVVSMLAEQTKGFVPFFTKSDFQKMQVTPKTGAGALNKPGKVFLPPSSPKLCQCTLFPRMTQPIDTGEKSCFQHLSAHWIAIAFCGEYSHPSASLRKMMGTHARSPN
uniref:Uncharacterized protein n=1 Tax=Aquila chrysaetos chrysaetos TaxID=223781 RepID=A0A663F677_AQUCH